MLLKLYRNKSETIKLDKQLELFKEINGTLRDSTNILSPSFIIQTDNIPEINYVFVPSFSRYYFINSIDVINNNLIQINCKVDVLTTYSTQLRDLNAMVSRNQNKFNMFIEDKLLDFEYIPQVSYINNITYYRNFSSWFDYTPSQQPYNIVINIISNDLSQLDIYQEDSYLTLPRINAMTSGDGTNSNIYVIKFSHLLELSKKILEDDTLNTFIKSVIILPFNFNENDFTDDVFSEISIGSKKINIGTGIRILKNKSYMRIKYASFDIPLATSFIDFKPYTKYYCYIPFYQNFELDIERCNGSLITIFFNINFESGECNIYLYNETTQQLIMSDSCTLGVIYSLSSTNNEENTRQRQNARLNAVINSIVPAGEVLLGAINPTYSISGLIGMTMLMNNLSKTGTTLNSIYDLGKIGITRGTFGLQLPNNIVIRKLQMKSVNNDDNFNILYGRPLYEVVCLNTLNGFTVIDSIHLENLTYATLNEINELENLLKKGVIF